ncbi:MAG TPA: DMT family transporter [Thermoanaerobaculia bacterium]|nr:DMT family transporter [Thermoanaerobaculia bacterium]
MGPNQEERTSPGKLRADAVLLAVTVVWGSSFVVVRHALETAPPFALLFWRFATALVLAAAAVAVLRRRRPARLLRDGTVLGTLLAAGMSLQVLGQAETTATKAAFLTGLAVVLTPFVAVFRTGRLPTLENGLGIALASVGFLLLTYPGRGGAFQRGDIWVAACGVVFAFYGVELAERAGKHDALWLTVVQLSFVVALAAALALAFRAAPLSGTHAGTLEARAIPLGTPGGFVWSIVYLGSLGTFAAFLGWTWSQGRMSAIHGAIILALEPVAASLLAAWLLGERPGRRGVAGAALVLGGIVVSEIRLRPRAEG